MVFIDGRELLELDLTTGRTDRLRRLPAEAFELACLLPDCSELAVRVAQGRVYLPHNGSFIDAGYVNFPFDSLIPLPDGQGFISTGLSNQSDRFHPAIKVAKRFDRSGRLVANLEPSWSSPTSQTLTSRGLLWTGDRSGRIEVRDVHSGLILDEFVAHQGAVTELIVRSDGTVASAGEDGTIHIWRDDILSLRLDQFGANVAADLIVANELGKRRQRLLASIIVDARSELLVSAADGYYWGSPRVLHQASFVDGEALFDYHRFDFWFNRPDLLLSRLGDSEPDTIARWSTLTDLRRKRRPEMPARPPSLDAVPSFELAGPERILQRGPVRLVWETEGGERLHVVVNGVPVFGKDGRRLERGEGEVSISLTNGENRIRAYVTDKSGVPSVSRYRTYHGHGIPTQRTLVVLAVGVSDYRDDKFELNYAAKDARDITALFERAPHVDAVRTATLLDADVTRTSVLEARKLLEATDHDDTVIVFLSGHGFLGDGNEYFYGTSDIDPNDPSAQGLSYTDINDLLDGIPARDKLLMLDTCHSGEVTDLSLGNSTEEGERARGIVPADGLRRSSSLDIRADILQKNFIDLRASTGAVVISASGGLEYALENAQVSNGYFTEAVIQGLASATADQDGDGRISTKELRDYTYSEVLRLSGGRQRPTTRAFNLDSDFDVY